MKRRPLALLAYSVAGLALVGLGLYLGAQQQNGGAGLWVVEAVSLDFWASDIMNDGVTVIAGSALNGDVYRSIDEGLTWQKIWTVPGTPDRILTVFVGSRDQIFVVMDGDYKLWRSIDKGDSWQISFPDAGCYPDGLTEDPSGALYLATISSQNGFCNVYKSIDAGITWSLVLSYSGTGKHFHHVQLNPRNGWLYAFNGDISSDGCYTINEWRSEDRGTTWQPIYSPDVKKGPEIMGVGFKGSYVYLTTHWARGRVLRFYENRSNAEVEDLGSFGMTLVNWLRTTPDERFILFGGEARTRETASVWFSETGDRGDWKPLVARYNSHSTYRGFACASHRWSRNGWLFIADTIGGQGIRIKYQAS